MTLEELEIVVKANVEEATKKLEELKAQMEGIDNKKTEENFEQMSIEADKMGEAMKNSGESTKDLTGAIKVLTPTLVKGAGGSASMGSAVSGLASSLSAVAPVILAVAGAIVLGIIKIKLIIAELKAIGKIVKSIATPAIKVISKLFSEFASLVKNQVSRALSTLRAKLNAGINNLVQVSDSLNEALSSLKSSLTQTGNALATAVAPAIEAIIPLMTSLLGVVIELANGFAQITASLFGNATTYKRATKVNEDYAKSLKGTGKAVKGVLASFDELNVISDNNSGTSVEDMFEDVPIEDKVLELTNRLKELWNTDNLEGLENFGKEIGEKVTAQINDLPTYEWAQKIGMKINDALALVNGFLSTNPRTSIRTQDSTIHFRCSRNNRPKTSWKSDSLYNKQRIWACFRLRKRNERKRWLAKVGQMVIRHNQSSG